MQKMLCRTEKLEAEKSQLEKELDIVAGMTQELITENARIAQDQTEYQRHYEEMVRRYNVAKARYDEVTDEIRMMEAKNIRFDQFIKALKEQDGVLTEFDETLWGCLIDYVEIGRNKDMKYVFRDGTEITV